MWENIQQSHWQKLCKDQRTFWRHNGNGGVNSMNRRISTARWRQRGRMIRFTTSSSGTDNNGEKRTICRRIFSLETENTGTKNLGGVQNVLDIYVSRTLRHQQVDSREYAIRSKFRNGIGHKWQKIGCGNGKPCGEHVKWQILGWKSLGNKCTIGETNFQKGCNYHTIYKRNIKSSEHHHQNFRQKSRH